jgi:integrase
MANKIRGRNEGSLSKRPNGKWRAQISIMGKRISYGSQKKEECQTWLHKMQTKVSEGQNFDGSRQTVSEFMSTWLAGAKLSMRFTTWRQYQGLAKNYILPGIGKIKIMELRPDHLQHLFDSLIGKGIGYYAILKAHTMLRSALSRAVKLELIPKNPASLVVLPRKPATEMHILDESQVNRLLVASIGHRLEALIHLAIIGGMREMELLGLKWTDLDWGKQTLKVERQLLRAHGEGIQFSSPKTKYGKRSLKLGSKTTEILRKHYNLQQEDRIKSGDQWRELGLMFPNHFGGPLEFRNLIRDYRILLQATGLPRIRFHDLRHTAASIMLNHNIPVIVVSRRLGHSKPSITLDIYGHLMANAQDEVAELLDEMITPIEIPVFSENCTNLHH